MEELKFKTFELTYHCSNCNNGQMIYTGKTAAHLKFEHKCNNCFSLDSFNNIYPKIYRELFPKITSK